MYKLRFDQMISAHESLVVPEDAPLLPKQLELGRAGFHVDRVYVHHVFDEANDIWDAGWWCLVRMSEDAEDVWRKFYSRFGFERIKHPDGWDGLEYLQAPLLFSAGTCITDKLWMAVWLLEIIIEELPVTQICPHRVKYQVDELTSKVDEHLKAKPDDYATCLYNVDSLKTNDLRLLFREYYSYEIVVDDKVVYVGKGKGQRCAAHLTREEFQRFDELSIRVYRHLSEALALEDEARRIRQHGMDNLLNKVMPSGMDMSA